MIHFLYFYLLRVLGLVKIKVVKFDQIYSNKYQHPYTVSYNLKINFMMTSKNYISMLIFFLYIWFNLIKVHFNPKTRAILNQWVTFSLVLSTHKTSYNMNIHFMMILIIIILNFDVDIFSYICGQTS
jgi:hypothetical protein